MFIAITAIMVAVNLRAHNGLLTLDLNDLKPRGNLLGATGFF